MRKLWLIFALWPSLALAQTTYTTNTANASWHTSTDFTPNGTPTSVDPVIIANGDTLTCEAGTQCNAAQLSCASAGGTGVFIDNGTTNWTATGAVNQCATWIINPQPAVATANGTWSNNSASITLASITGTVSVGDAVWGQNIYPGTLVSAISGTALTITCPESPCNYGAGSATALSFFPPSVVYNSSTSYAWNIGYQNCSVTCPVLQINGAWNDPVTIETAAASSVNFGGFGGSNQGTGAIQGTWALFNSCGTTSSQCINTDSYGSIGVKTSLMFSTFTSSNVADLSSVQAGNSTSFTFAYNTVVNPINSSGYGLDLNPAGGDSTINCSILNNYIEGETLEATGTSADWGADDGCNVSFNAFMGTATVGPYSGFLAGHATNHFDANLFYNQPGATNIPAGGVSVTRSAILLVPDESGGGSHLYGFGVSPYANTLFNGGTIERQYNSATGADGTSSCFYSGGSGFAQTIENWVTVAAPNGGSPCMLNNVIGSSVSGASYTLLHNTAYVTPVATGGGFAPCAGEGSTAAAGLYPRCSDNLFLSTASAAGLGVGWFNSLTPVNNTFTQADYNGWSPNVTGSPYTSKYGVGASAYASTPGVHDVTANPNLKGCYNGSTTALANCNFTTWAEQQGISVSTWADIAAQLRAMNAPFPGALNNGAVLAYYNWVRQGHTPTNAALVAADDGGTMGAIPYLAPTPPQFAGLLMNSTDYTTSGSWTTPSVPATGASYTDSIFGITAYRLPAVTNCPINSVYNPSGSCSVTNTQMQVDYAKTVPWSVNENYYVADSNGWLFLYSRSSMGVYTFIRTLRTYCGSISGTCTSNYGATRDYGSGDASFDANLFGDGSNWLWANNASSNPDTIYYTGGSSSNPNAYQLKAYNADTDTISVVHDFTSTINTVNAWGTCGSPVNAIDMEREGNQSDDDRIWVFGVNDGYVYNNWCAVLVYDKLLDQVIALQSLDPGGLCGAIACPSQPNWVGASPSGSYAIINWDLGANDSTWTRGYGTEVYTNALGYMGMAAAYDGHGDVGRDLDGTEIFVTTPSNSVGAPYGNYAFGICNLAKAKPIAGAGDCRTYQSIPCIWSNSPSGCPVGSSTRGQTFFISGRGTHGAAVGWFALSTQTIAGSGYALSTGNGGWGALENDGFLAEWSAGSTNITAAVPPATSVVRIGRNHGILVNTDPYNQDYGSQANFSVDRTFTKGAWTSNFDVQPASGCSSSTPPGSGACNYYSMYTELGSSPPVTAPGVAPQLLFMGP